MTLDLENVQIKQGSKENVLRITIDKEIIFKTHARPLCKKRVKNLVHYLE